MRAALPYLALAAVIIGFGNFFWAFAESMRLGGDGLNGYQQNGRCFVGAHGLYTEVPCEDWERSRIHALSVFLLSAPLMMGGMACLLFTVVFPITMKLRTGGETQEKVQFVRASGVELASFGTSWAKVASTSFTGPMIYIAVYPAGIVVKPRFMPPAAIMSSEMQELSEAKGPWWDTGLQITHSSRDIGSPIVLGVTPDSDAGRAIRAVTDVSIRQREEASAGES